MIWAADAPSSAESFLNPSFLLNLGAVGYFLFMFMTDRVHSKGAMDRERAVQERLIMERDRALAERDEMIEVMKDFTHTASAILHVDPGKRPAPRRRVTDER
jgi:hypothetical protein